MARRPSKTAEKAESTMAAAASDKNSVYLDPKRPRIAKADHAIGGVKQMIGAIPVTFPL